MKRPVTGRDGLGTMEGEDYDGQSGATKEDSNDTDLGQSISVTSGGSIFYDVVDFSDAGVGSVQMRVNASAATNLEFHADSATGTLLGKCAVAATGGSWATQILHVDPDERRSHALRGLRRRRAPQLAAVPTGVHQHDRDRRERRRDRRLERHRRVGGKSGTGGTGTTGTGGTGTTGTGGTGTTGTGGTGTTGTGGTGTTGTGGAIVSGAGGTGTTGAGGAGTGGAGTGAGGSGTGRLRIWRRHRLRWNGPGQRRQWLRLQRGWLGGSAGNGPAARARDGGGRRSQKTPRASLTDVARRSS